LMEDSSVDPGALTAEAEAMRADGQTVMFVAVDGKLAGLIGVADPIKSSTPEAIRQLHEENIRIVMLTGDSRTTAQAVASKLVSCVRSPVTLHRVIWLAEASRLVRGGVVR